MLVNLATLTPTMQGALRRLVAAGLAGQAQAVCQIADIEDDIVGLFANHDFLDLGEVLLVEQNLILVRAVLLVLQYERHGQVDNAQGDKGNACIQEKRFFHNKSSRKIHIERYIAYSHNSL